MAGSQTNLVRPPLKLRAPVKKGARATAALFDLQTVEWALLGLVVVALAIRVKGITFGLPFLYNPDERLVIDPALDLLKNSIQAGALTAVSQFEHPTLYRFVQWVGSIVSFVLYARQDVFKTTAIPYAEYWRFYTLGRLITALVGTACIPVLYKVGKALYAEKVGLVAAGLLAVSALHVEFSHYIQTDVPALFLVLLSLWFAWRICEDGGWINYGLTGFFVGLATATQYRSLAALVLLVVAHLLRRRKTGSTASVYLWLGLGAFAVGFLIGCPYPLLKLSLFLQGLFAQVADVRLYQPSALVWLAQAGDVLRDKVGIIPIALGMGGAFVALRRHDDGDLLLLGLVATYLVMLPVFREDATRDILPLLSVLMLFGARFASVVASWVVDRTQLTGRLALAPLVGLVIVAMVGPGVQAVHLVRSLGRRDTSTQMAAAAWLRENAPPLNGIAVESYAPLLSDYRMQSFSWALGADHPLEWYREQGYSVAVLTDRKLRSESLPRYANVPTFRRSVEQNGLLLKEFRGSSQDEPTIRIYQIGPSIAKSGDMLLGEGVTSLSPSQWMFHDGTWEIEGESVIVRGWDAPVNGLPNPDLRDEDGNGVPDGWRLIGGTLAALDPNERALQVSGSNTNEGCYSPEIPVPPRGYTLTLEIKADIANPRFNIQYDALDADHRPLRSNAVLERFDDSIAWQRKSYRLSPTDLPVGTRYIRLQFLWY